MGKMRVLAALNLLLVGAVTFVGCGPVREPDPYLLVRVSTTMIRDGNGYQKLPGTTKDYFTIHLELLEHPSQGVRRAAAMRVSVSSVMAATYPWLIDAYADYGPVDRLQETLLRVRSGAELGSEERWYAGMVYVHFRERRYVWTHPDEVGKAGLARARLPFKGFEGQGTAAGMRLIAQKLIAEGDRDFIRVWEDHQHHERLLLKGLLKPIRWDDTGQGGEGKGKGKGPP